MERDRSWTLLWAISLLAGSSLGLVEATWVMERRVGIGEGVLVLLVGALGYAAVSALIATVWYLVAAARTRRTTEQIWATAVCIPLGLMVALIAVTELGTGDGTTTNGLRLIAAGALGVQAVVLVRLVARRFPALGRLSTWLTAHGIILFLAVLTLIMRRGNESGTWLGLLGTGLLIGVVWSWSRRRGEPRRVCALVLTNALVAGCLLLLPVLAGGSVPDRGQMRGRPNVVLITIDTLRADHLGAHGYSQARTPNIDRMAAEGVQFLTAVAPIAITCPSHASILTGRYPIEHGALRNHSLLPPSSSTIAESLSRNGYESGAIVSGYTLKDAACGLGDRFGTYDDNFSSWPLLPDNAVKLRLVKVAVFAASRSGADLRRAVDRLDRPAELTTDLALNWIKRNREQPFFLWVHYFDPHVPYEPPPPYDRLHDPDYSGPSMARWYQTSTGEKDAVVNDPRAVRHMIALYDGEISYVDAQVGRLRAALDDWGLSRDTLVVLTADHGESLGDHELYFEHSSFLYDAELRVPLIMLFPPDGPGRRRVADQVRLIDVAPTIMDYLGIDGPPDPGGHSLRALIEVGQPDVERPALAAVHPGTWKTGRSIYALRDKGHKLIWTSPQWQFLGLRVPPSEELYDLTADPGERHNLAGAAPPILAELRRDLLRWRERERSGSRVAELDEAAKARLRSLGYLQ